MEFELKESVYASLTKFSLRTGRFYPAAEDKTKSWRQVGGGIPLAWRSEDKSIFVDDTDAHTLIIGSTGSKKSRLLAMPTVKLLGYAGESMIVTDPKAEIYNRTAYELNKNGYQISVINLRMPLKSNYWNPLEIPYRFFCNGDLDKAYEFANDIAVNLMLSERSTSDPFWDESACNLFFGLILLLFRLCKECNETAEQVNIDNLLFFRQELFKEHTSMCELKKTMIWEKAKADDDDIIKSSLIGTVGAPEKTQASILSTFDNKMRTFVIQPTLSQMLSKGNTVLNTIGTKKTAVFLIMPDEKTSYHKLVSLFVKQSYEYLIYQAQLMPKQSMPIRINYILDEFSSLPTIGDFPSMITAARSRNIRFDLIIQSKHQLLQRYGNEAETIQSNCTNWIFLTSRELPLLQDISALCGMKNNGGRPLLSISDLQRFSKEKGETLILCGRRKPFKTFLPDIDIYDKAEFSILPFPDTDYETAEQTFAPVSVSADDLLEIEQKEIATRFNNRFNKSKNPNE